MITADVYTETLARAVKRAASLVKPESIWTPNPGMQARVVRCIEETRVDQIWILGQAGGGKTHLPPCLALTHFKNTIFFRKEFKALEGAEGPVENARPILKPYADPDYGDHAWNDNKHMWRLKALGQKRTIKFAGCRNRKDAEDFQGKAHDCYAFDEITQWSPDVPNYVTSWRRSKDPNQRTLELYMGNPPTSPEGEWVIDRIRPWIANAEHPHPNPALEGEVRYFVPGKEGIEHEVPGPERIRIDGEDRLPLSRTFFFCRLAENPTYALGGYADTLERKPEPERSILLRGDFWASQAPNAWQVIPSEWIRLAQERRREEIARGFDPREAGKRADSHGWDIAHGGADNTVGTTRWGRYVGDPEVWPGKGTPDGFIAASLILERISRYGGRADVDANGVGASAADIAKAKAPTKVRGIMVQESCDLRDRSDVMSFSSIRDFMWWNGRELLDPNNPECVSISLDPLLAQELKCARWKSTMNGVKIQPKQDDTDHCMKALLGGRSPDRAESFLLALLPESLKMVPGLGFLAWAKARKEKQNESANV